MRTVIILMICIIAVAVAAQAPEAYPTQAAHKYPRAMWVWKSLEPMMKGTERKELLDFCQKYGIDEIFFQFQGSFSGSGRNIKYGIKYEEELRSFIKDSHRAEVKVHMLDGNAEYVLKVNHPKVLAEVAAVIDFNRRCASDERFDGIHLDNEPYLLIGFDSPLKGEILKQYLELNQKCVELIRSSGEKIVYGVDIPFWFDSVAVTYGGKEKPVAHHVLDITDNVGIMDYRNYAKGEDGIIAFGMEEVKYASRAGKKIYIGVETFASEPQRAIFVYGLPEYEFNKRLAIKSQGGAFADKYYYKGFKISRVSDGQNVHVGLLIPPEVKDEARVDKVIRELARVFGKDVYAMDKENISEMSFNIEWALSKDPQYRGTKITTMTGDRSGTVYIKIETNIATLPKTTFAGMSKSDMEKAFDETEEAFKNHPGFYGFAIHYYDSYKAMKD